MKINIEVEIDPSEVAATTELFALLRQLSDKVSHRNLRKLFKGIVLRLGDPANYDSVASDLRAIVQQEESAGNLQFAAAELYESLADITLGSDASSRPDGVVPYLLVIPVYVSAQ